MLDVTERVASFDEYNVLAVWLFPSVELAVLGRSRLGVNQIAPYVVGNRSGPVPCKWTTFCLRLCCCLRPYAAKT